MGVRRWMRWGGPTRAAAALAVVSLAAVAGALSAATVLAWSVGDFSITTTTYTTSTAPTPSSPGAPSAKAVVGQFLSDSQAVTVAGFDFLPPSDYQFALYAGTPSSSMCPVSVGGSNVALPAGYVFESGVYATSQDTGQTTTVSSTQASPGSYQVMAPGAYYWVARYYDTKDNITVFSECTSEVVQVTAESPTITTQASRQGAVVGQATMIGDTATFQGAMVAPTGSVTFTLYSDSSCQTAVLSGSGPIISSEGGSTASLSTSWTFTQTGSYYWVASYLGDSNNKSYTSPCQVASETVQVTAESPTITTQASPQAAVAGKATTVGDTATFQGAMVPPTGTVAFTLYSNSSCTDVVLSGSGSIATTAGASTASFSTTWTPAQQGSYYWVASYAGDSNNNSYTSPCRVASETITVSSSGGVLGAGTTTPGTGADLAGPGAIAALLALLGAVMVAFGTRLRRRHTA